MIWLGCHLGAGVVLASLVVATGCGYVEETVVLVLLTGAFFGGQICFWILNTLVRSSPCRIVLVERGSTAVVLVASLVRGFVFFPN